MRTASTIQQVNQNTLHHIGILLEDAKISYVYEGETKATLTPCNYTLIIVTDQHIILGSCEEKAINAYKRLGLHMFRKEDFVSFYTSYNLTLTFKHNQKVTLKIEDRNESYIIQKELMEVLAF